MTVADGRLRSDSERTRQQILRVAREMCREDGYENIRIADIAKRVGCVRATVYNHFASRDLLLEAVCAQYLAGYLRIPEQIQAWTAPDNTVFDVLRETVATELRWRAAHGALRGALDSARRLRKDFYVYANARVDEAMLAWYEAIYGASATHGLLHSELDLTFAAAPVYAMTDSVVIEFDVNTPEQEVERVADQIARLQWYALYAGEPEAAPLFSSLGITPLKKITRRRKRAVPAALPEVA